MAEYNPYEPPKSAVADRPKPRLPRTVRVLRALAVIGSALTGLISLVMPFAVPGSAVSGALMIAALLLLFWPLISWLIGRLKGPGARDRE